MEEIKAYAAAIIQYLSGIDVKATSENMTKIMCIHSAVGKITELASSPVTAKAIPMEEKL